MQSVGLAQSLMAAAGGVGAGANIAGGYTRSQVLKQNAANLDYAGTVYQASGRDEARQQTLEFAQLAGKQQAGYAGGGVVTNTGSAQQTAVDTATQGAQQISKALFTGDFEAWKARSEANQTRFQAKQSITSGYTNAAMGLLTTGADIATIDMKRDPKRYGAF